MTTLSRTPTAAEMDAYIRRGSQLRSQYFCGMIATLAAAIRRIPLLPAPPAKTA